MFVHLCVAAPGVCTSFFSTTLLASSQYSLGGESVQLSLVSPVFPDRPGKAEQVI